MLPSTFCTPRLLRALLASPLAASVVFAIAGLVPVSAQNLPVDPPEPVAASFQTAYDVELVDWNRDARPDILAASFGGSGIKLWRNEPFGYVESTFPISGRAAALDVGDIDGDGRPDLLYGIDNPDSANDRVGVVLNRDPDLLVTVDATNIDGTEAVRLADLDGDGDLDAITAEFGGGEVSWHENTDGDGESWTTRVVTSGLGAPVDVHGHDVDLDGDLDIVLMTFLQLVWIENRLPASPQWVVHTIDASVPGGRRLAAGDVDGDGQAEIVAAAVNTPLLAWWDRPALVTDPWTRYVIANQATSDVALDDMDQDGDLDLVTTRWAFERAPRFWQNDGTGSFTGFDLLGISDLPRALALADLDLDGDRDIAIATGESNGVVALENRLVRSTAFLGSIEENRQVPREPTLGDPNFPLAMAPADLDRDGDLDLVSYDADGVLRVRDRFDDAQGTTLAVIGDTLLDHRAFGLGDFDGDGDLDVAIGLDTGFRWYENLDVVFVPKTISASARVSDLLVVDTNGDGHDDLADYDAQTGLVRAWRNVGPGASWSAGFLGDVVSYGDLTAGDVNGDGLLDLILSADGELRWFERLADIAYQPHVIDDSFASPHLVTGDFDTDGDVDIAGNVPGPNTLRFWVNDGLGGWSVQDSDFVAGVEALGTADYDLDGDLDVVGVSEGGFSAIVFTPRSSPNPFPIQPFGFPDLRSRLLAVGDFTGDGFPDTVGAPSGDFPVLSATLPGQYAARFSPEPSGTVMPGQIVPLYALDLEHAGRPGDQDIVLDSISLTVSIDGQPATREQIRDLFTRLQLKTADDSVILGTVESPDSPSPVVVEVAPSGGAENVPAPPAPDTPSSRRYRLEAQISPSTSVEQLLIRLNSTTDAIALDSRGTPLKPLPGPIQVRVFTVEDNAIFRDGFDNGDPDAWAAVFP